MMRTPDRDSGRSGRGYARTADGRQLHYRFAGAKPCSAPPLLCLHCSPISSRVFEAFLAPMARDRRVIAIDTPGYGGSDALAGEASIDGYAAAIGEAVAGIVEGPVDLFGYHTGSAVALALAAARPGAVRRLVLNSALIFDETERAGLAMFEARKAMTVAQHVADIPAYWRFFRDFWPELPDDASTWPLFLDSLLGPGAQMDGFFAAFAYDFAAALRDVAHPLLLLNPSDDLHAATLRAKPLLKPDGRMLDLPGWTHGFLHARAEETAALLRSFLTA